MHKTFAVLSLILLMFFTNSPAKSLNVYTDPSEQAKIVTKMKSGEALIPIYQPKDQEWLKVANPANGDVGWVKAKELNGPQITIKSDGSSYSQQIVTKSDDKDKPQSYQVVKYSHHEMKPEQVKKILHKMEKRQKKLEKNMYKMMEHMYKNMQNFWGEEWADFDKKFEEMPMFMPIVVVPHDEAKATAKTSWWEKLHHKIRGKGEKTKK